MNRDTWPSGTRYALYLKQDGEGCDYTVGCGAALIPLKATEREAACAEAEMQIADLTHSECTFTRALLIDMHHVEEASPLIKRVEARRAEAAAKRTQDAKRAELERLKRELGES